VAHHDEGFKSPWHTTKLHDALFQLLGGTPGVVKVSPFRGERFYRGGEDFLKRPSLRRPPKQVDHHRELRLLDEKAGYMVGRLASVQIWTWTGPSRLRAEMIHPSHAFNIDHPIKTSRWRGQARVFY